MATAQDVGKAMNPQQLEGQIEGGTSHGVGLALMEEIQVVDGKVRNPSFTDYLIPAILDMPTVQMTILELADEHAPYGLRGVGETPVVSSTPARGRRPRATGLDLVRRRCARGNTSPLRRSGIWRSPGNWGSGWRTGGRSRWERVKPPRRCTAARPAPARRGAGRGRRGRGQGALFRGLR